MSARNTIGADNLDGHTDSRLKLPCYRASASTNNSIAVARTYKRD